MRQAIEILMRRKRLFTVPLIAVFVIPAIISMLFMRSYEANSLVWLDSDVSVASVLKGEVVDEGATRPIQTEAETLQQLLQSRTFITKVVEGTRLQDKMDTAKGREQTIEFVRKNMRTEVVGANSLRISFFGRSPDEAVTVVDRTTAEFLAWVQGAVKTQNQKSVGFFSAQADSYRKELQKARVALQNFKESHPEAAQLDIADKVLSAPNITASPAVQSEFGRLKSQTDYAQQLYDSSLSDLAKTRVLSAARVERYTNGLHTVDQPVVPTSFSLKRLLLFDLVALMAAIMIGGLAVILAELTDRSVHTERDVEDLLDLQVLSEVRQTSPVSES